MKKAEIKSATNDMLVYTMIDRYGVLLLKSNYSGRGTKGIEKECRDIADELIIRGLLTKEQVDKLFF